VTLASNVPQTAAFARRLFCRALTVVGGVAAGTALAWFLSSASASAEVRTPAEDQVSVAVEQATTPVEQTVETAVQLVQDPPPPPKDPLADLGAKVKDAAEQFGNQAQGLPALAATGVEKREYSADPFGRANFPTTPALVPVEVAGAPAVDAVTPRTAKDRAFADGMSRRGSPEPVQPASPDLPDWPMPFAPTPAGIPTTVNHGSAGNAADSHLFAALPWQNSTTDLVAGGLAATTSAATQARPGAQPGVAPD
jgi:hypothetical protein